MAYTTVWNEANPTGAEAANTIDDIFRSGKVDLRERLGGIFGLTALQFAADPIAPISLTLSGALSFGSISGNLTLSSAVSRIIPGATSLSLRNNANSADNLIITDAGLATIRNTLTNVVTTGVGTLISVSGGTNQQFIQLGNTSGTAYFGIESSVSGAFFTGSTAYDSVVYGGPLSIIVSGNLISRFSTTAFTLSKNLVLSSAASKIIPGATSISFRNNADSADNLLISDAGLVTLRNALTTTQLFLSSAVSKIIPGSTSLSLRNNADSADNLIITDGGQITTRGNVIVGGSAGIGISSIVPITGVAIPNATATTIIDTSVFDGVYMVTVNGIGVSSATGAWAVVWARGSNLTIMTSGVAGFFTAFSVVGSVLKITQNSGSPGTFIYSYLKMNA